MALQGAGTRFGWILEDSGRNHSLGLEGERSLPLWHIGQLSLEVSH